MALNNRQTSLLVQQNWTKVYETFKEADFQSYDFETLRKTMIDYLRTYYPEDFNDFTESSEYVALIDLIAFLGQSLAFRADLNTRENFIDTAERRDSVLKLARLINYHPKRNIAASGLLKIESISTTENVYDSNGTDLANLIISWDDVGNDNWQEQFNSILNAALVDSQTVGKGANSQLINGVSTTEYTLSSTPSTIPAYRFATTVEGTNLPFEVVSASSVGKQFVYEQNPTPKGKFNILYRNDKLGNSSNNSGFFVYFKQGSLNSVDFNISNALPNRLVDIDFDGINNSDTWLFKLDANNAIDSEWAKVPAIAGINIAYNKSEDRNLYQVVTRNDDRISLSFGDGSFANTPVGNFRLYYRQSAGYTYKITPDEIQNVNVPVSYIDRNGRTQVLTLRVSLKYTIANSSPRETVAEIREKAPQQYYTQNRMITGEDYNIFPYTAFNTIQKVKATNRTSSGVSRFLDVVDVTGKYSSTNIFSADGALYKDEYQQSLTFGYQTTNEIFSVIYNQIEPLLKDKPIQHLHYDKGQRFDISDHSWRYESRSTNKSIGYFVDQYDQLAIDAVGVGVSGVLGKVIPGAILKFSAGAGKYFNTRGQIKTGVVTKDGDKTFIYASVQQVNSETNQVTISEFVPTGAEPVEVIPVFKNILTDSMFNEMINLIKVYKNFGLRYNNDSNAWALIESQDLGDGPFSNEYVGDTSAQALDTSWFIKFEYNGNEYKVTYRGLDYYFESVAETKFYFDNTTKVFDSKTGTTINDTVTVLKFNSQADSALPLAQNLSWSIYKNIVESDGYQDNRKILVTFPDSDGDGIPDNPDLFDLIVASQVNANSKFVFFKVEQSSTSFIAYLPIDYDLVEIFDSKESILLNNQSYTIGQLFYTYSEDKFYELTTNTANIRTVVDVSTTYRARIGRGRLNFQYKHNSPNNRRIDPSPNNIMDLFILTKTYASDYIAWINDTSGTVKEPVLPTNEELKSEYAELENYKAMSDTIIYNSARFKPVFGSVAESTLQAKFKVVKNPNMIISDSDIKTSVVAAINTYFDINNWDFGETFYFSELSAYLHTELTPQIASIIIVPGNASSQFGNLYQINAEADEILISCATVDNIDIISAITASQLNQTLSGLSTSA